MHAWGGGSGSLNMLRRAGAAVACALAGAVPGLAPAQVGLPLRNLLIEVRQGEDVQGSVTRQGATGSVTITSSPRSSSNVSGAASVHSGRTDSTRHGDTAQQVLVLNGGRAAVRLGQTHALQWYQVAWNGRDGPTLLPSTLIVEAGRGVVVHPRWPGGDHPVTLEVTAESSRLPTTPGDASGPVREAASASTTVQLPLGEWVTVAGTAETFSQQDQRAWSSREASHHERRVVQIRVTAR